MTRQEKYAEIMKLRSQGWVNQRIANALGLTYSGLRNIINDPDGSKQKARRERYRGTCAECGKHTDGSSGFNAPNLCAHCNGLASRVWTRENIIEAIRSWAAEHGEPPRSRVEWLHACPDGTHPTATSVYRGRDGKSNPGAPFATWNEAIEAAGFEPRQIGKYERTPEQLELLRTMNLGRPGKKGPNPKLRRFDYDEARRLHDAGVSITDLAARFGVTYSGMRSALRRTYEAAA